MGHHFEDHEEAELQATPEQVWEAIATGPGIDSWFMGRNQVEPGEGGKVLAIAPDGLEVDPGFVIFVQNAAGETYLCNATGDAMIWAFEPVGDPLEDGGRGVGEAELVGDLVITRLGL